MPDQANELLEALEKAIIEILNNPKAKPGERNAAIANGVKLLATRHSIRGGDTPDFFGSDAN
jgi:hypothetical protein